MQQSAHKTMAFCAALTAASATTNPPLKVFLLAGQSNMEGKARSRLCSCANVPGVCVCRAQELR